ncbi:MAG: thiamine pyrophosphate-binding protein [Thermoleophilia bacterium]|nr:thiamine pyrophosphate-binding protein [Thermoleophilia bacterium]
MPVRTGGRVVIESLEALGAQVAFGLPGIHAMPMWDALRTSAVRGVALRSELNAGFAADGYARVSRRPAPLLLSTGPGALISLAALMEAASSHVPVVAISSQIPGELLGKRRGYLHELPDQLASFAPVVKSAARADSAEAIPELLAQAWRCALTPPAGPVYVEVPWDVLKDDAGVTVGSLDGAPAPLAPPDSAALGEAASVLAAAERPAIWAGGGVLAAGAWEELRELAERLRAPVATTFMGKGALPEDHPLAAGSACSDGAFAALLEDADAVLAVGTELGAETTSDWRLRLPTLIHADVAPERIGASYPAAVGLVGDARETLAALAAMVPAREPDGRAEARVAALREAIGRGLVERGAELEAGLLRAIRAALPADAIGAWDMTILAYLASSYFPVLAPRRWLYPLGSGTLGYAWPAALGAKLALPDTPALAVHGDGGFQYGLAELASARQHGIDAALLLVDDGGYGILRQFQLETHGEPIAVDLAQPDFVRLAEAFGVPVRVTSPASLAEDLEWALAASGPAVVVLRQRLRWLQATG